MRKLTEPTPWHRHQLNHPDVSRVPEPKLAYPVHIELEDPLNRGLGTVDLMEVSREELLENFEFPPVETDTYRNLQVWLDNQGQALYNPIWWMQTEFDYSHLGRYPHAKGHFVDLHGSHRIRSLERLQLPYIYVYIHRGPTFVTPWNPHWVTVQDQLNINDSPPNTPTESGNCEKCGKNIRWDGPPKTGDPLTSGAENYKATRYHCRECGYVGERSEVYPEPV